MSWIGDILWSVWAGLSTVGSILFLLLTGLALFGLFVGVPHLIGLRRKRNVATRALAAIPQAVRDEVLAQSRALGGYPSPEAILSSAPELRAALSGHGVPAEELIDRMLATEAPPHEEPADDLQ